MGLSALMNCIFYVNDWFIGSLDRYGLFRGEWIGNWYSDVLGVIRVNVGDRIVGLVREL